MLTIEVATVLGMLAAGVSLWIVERLLRIWLAGARVMRLALRNAGSVLIALGLLGVCLALPLMWGLVAWLTIIGVWIRTVVHVREVERRNLLAGLMLAARQGVPLAPIAAAFADEHDGGVAARARELAGRLQGGGSLADAVWMVPGALPPEAAMACRFGLETGDLHGALAAATEYKVFDRGVFRPLMLRGIYIAPALALFLIFMQLKIVPAMIKIFDDFDSQLPPLTIAVLRGTQLPLRQIEDGALGALLAGEFGSAQLGALVALVLIMAPLVCLISIVVLLWAWLEWRGTIRARLPVWKRIVNWIDMAPLLRMLALSAERSQPLTQAIGTIVDFHPKRSVRRRMQSVENDVEAGANWQASLARWRFLSPADSALLIAAERVRNLPWVLRKLADSFERRANYRLQATARILLPLLFVPVGLVVGVLVVAYFTPLTELIRQLAL
jgi:type II secretory pathway component PulF